MITTVNPDNNKFKNDISEDIYVDKTLIIDKLNKIINKRNNKICISRPRRFGKTMTTNLLTAYYSCSCDSRDLFQNTKLSKIENWDKYLNKFNIIKIDVQEIYGVAKELNKDLAAQIREVINKDLVNQFPHINELDVNNSLSENIISVCNATNKQFVMIMDEYDVLVREKKNDEVLKNYLDLLNTLFKGASIDEAFALVYLTGIFPIIRDTFQSKLNNFTEYSMTAPGNLAGFIGFTEDEVKDLCDEYNMDFNKCKNWYDGYKIGNEVSVYNPCSVVKAMYNHEYSDYWSSTGSYESISDYIIQNVDGIHDSIKPMLEDNVPLSVNIEEFLNRIDNLNSKDDILTYLIHIGYLAYDKENELCYIPNNEIRKEWVKALKKVPDMHHFYELFKASECILDGLTKKNTIKVCENLDKIHHSSGDVNSYGNEAALHTSLITAMTYARSYYNVLNELSTGKGRTDIVYLPKNNYSNYPTFIFELKVDKSPEEALKQIHEKEYAYNIDSDYKKNMLLVGINYNKSTNKHECIIEQYKDQ